MNRRLIVYVGEHWPTQPSTPWVVLDDRGQVIEQGQSDPRYWPAAEHCEAVLAAPLCSWIEVKLPEGARREPERLLRYAVEDRVAGDIDHQHLTLISQRRVDDGVLVVVLVCNRARLREILTALAACNRPAMRMHAELQAEVGEGEDWTLALGVADHGVLHPGPGRPRLALDKAACEPLLAHLLDQARRVGQAPTRLVLRYQSGAGGLDAGVLAERLALPVVEGAPYCWWSCRKTAADLLHGELRPAHRRAGWYRRLRRPLALAGTAMVVFFLASLGEVLWQKQQLAALEQRMQRLFESAVPNTPAVAPALQLRRHLDEMRSKHGLLRQDDALTLLAAFADSAGSGAKGALSAIDYEAGQLKLSLRDASALNASEVAGRLAIKGYRLRQNEDGTWVISQEIGR